MEEKGREGGQDGLVHKAASLREAERGPWKALLGRLKTRIHVVSFTKSCDLWINYGPAWRQSMWKIFDVKSYKNLHPHLMGHVVSLSHRSVFQHDDKLSPSN